MSRLQERYVKEIKPALHKELEIKNVMDIPGLEKIIISVGAGADAKDKKIIQNIQDTVSLISGQHALVTKAKKSIAGFKLREGTDSGIKVTLRNENMYNFLDKLISISLPRVKDFRGVPRRGFDGNGNYNFGLDEQLVFPEIKYDNVVKTHGMNITIVTTTSNDKKSFKLLELLGLPFARGK